MKIKLVIHKNVMCAYFIIKSKVERYEKIVKSKVLIGWMTVVWLMLMANIIWHGTDGKWQVTDAEKIGQLEVAKYTNQIMVVAVSDEDVSLCLFERDSNVVEEISQKQSGDKLQMQKNMEWKLVLETEAIIGKNGLGKKKEGDGKTPVGVFFFVKAFGILENPGCKMEYTQVDEDEYWVDDSASKYYNKFVDVNEAEPDWMSAEHIVEYEESYHYVLATSYNVERIPGKGSAVFLHCTSEEAEATAGCIAIPEVYMQEIMKRVEPQCVLIVDKVENILSY